MGGSVPPPAGPPKSSTRELLERAAHDLKNPLAVVRASLEWLEVELVDREDALDAVRDATTAAGRLLVIADDLDALARLGETGVESRVPVPLLSLVNGVVSDARTGLGRRITVEAIGLDADPLEVTGDERLLRRSLTALVDAIARGAPTGACIDVKVARVASSSSERAVEIGVALRGAVDAGVPAPGSLEKSSLGVYVALRVVEAHGGSFAVVPTTSVPRIVVRLPC